MPQNLKHAVKIVLLLCINSIRGHKCPEQCKCQPTSINCAEKLLTEVPEIPEKMSEIVTDINLSSNDIEKITSNSFGNLESLKYLHLNENIIWYIDEKAFSGLRDLEFLNLAYNFLEIVLPEIITNNRHIQKLDLHGNDFRDGAPQLISYNLKILDLSVCNIQKFTKENIQGLPNLQVLFLHANYLTSIDVRIFQNFNIKHVSLGYNLWKCDSRTKRMLAYLIEKNIALFDVSLDCCTGKNL